MALHDRALGKRFELLLRPLEHVAIDIASDKGLSSAVLFAELTRQVPDDAIVCVDVGNNAYSGGDGAWAATQEDDPRFRGRKVVSVSGDSGFGQYMGA